MSSESYLRRKYCELRAYSTLAPASTTARTSNRSVLYSYSDYSSYSSIRPAWLSLILVLTSSSSSSSSRSIYVHDSMISSSSSSSVVANI